MFLHDESAVNTEQKMDVFEKSIQEGWLVGAGRLLLLLLLLLLLPMLMLLVLLLLLLLYCYYYYDDDDGCYCYCTATATATATMTTGSNHWPEGPASWRPGLLSGRQKDGKGAGMEPM